MPTRDPLPLPYVMGGGTNILKRLPCGNPAIFKRRLNIRHSSRTVLSLSKDSAAGARPTFSANSDPHSPHARARMVVHRQWTGPSRRLVFLERILASSFLSIGFCRRTASGCSASFAALARYRSKLPGGFRLKNFHRSARGLWSPQWLNNLCGLFTIAGQAVAHSPDSGADQ
jgi:hypothetical protein